MMKKKKEKYVLKCMCPPREISYFYTAKGKPLIDNHQNIKKNVCPNQKVKIFFV